MCAPATTGTWPFTVSRQRRVTAIGVIGERVELPAPVMCRPGFSYIATISNEAGRAVATVREAANG